MVRKRGLTNADARRLSQTGGPYALAAQLLIIRERPCQLDDRAALYLLGDIQWNVRRLVAFDPFYGSRTAVHECAMSAALDCEHRQIAGLDITYDPDEADGWRESLIILNRLGLVDATFYRQQRVLLALPQPLHRHFLQLAKNLYRRRRIDPDEPLYEVFKKLRHPSTKRGEPILTSRRDVGPGVIANALDY